LRALTQGRFLAHGARAAGAWRPVDLDPHPVGRDLRDVDL
jgi:hypothetical protein